MEFNWNKFFEDKTSNENKSGGLVVHCGTQEEKIDALTDMVKDIKAQLDKQDEQLAYIVARLDHMREKAHAKRENQTAWPK